MRCFILAALFVICPAVASAQAAPSAPAAAPTAPTSTAAAYSTTSTDLGTLLDDPAAKAVLLKEIPGVINNDGISMARAMTLKSLQTYAADQLTDAKLASIDAQFAKLKK